MAEINGKAIANKVLEAAKEKIKNLNLKPGLGVVLVGNREDSKIYTTRKQKAGESIGVTTQLSALPETATQDEIISAIKYFANNPKVHGVMVQLPLPQPQMTDAVLAAIPHDKDVDGLNLEALTKISNWRVYFQAPKHRVITKILEESEQDKKLQNVKYVFVSNFEKFSDDYQLMSDLSNRTACTVQGIHPDNPKLSEITRSADILVSIVGRPHFIKANMIKPGAVVIDFGSTMVQGKPQGDVDFEEAKNIAAWITPVPGGTGPMTVAYLLSNVVEAAEQQAEKDSSK